MALILYLIGAVVGALALWFIIRTAVHSAVSQALAQYDEHQRQNPRQ